MHKFDYIIVGSGLAGLYTAWKASHPHAKTVVHPECPAEIVDEADYVGSTSGILEYCGQSHQGSRETLDRQYDIHKIVRHNGRPHIFVSSPAWGYDFYFRTTILPGY